MRNVGFGLCLCSLLSALPLGCGSSISDEGADPGTSTAPLKPWVDAVFEQVLRVKQGEATVRHHCEVTIPIAGTPSMIISASSSTVPEESVAYTGAAVSSGGLSVSGCAVDPCVAVVTWQTTAPSGSTFDCQVSADDGSFRHVATSTGTALSMPTPLAPRTLLFNERMHLPASGIWTAGSCTWRLMAGAPAAVVNGVGIEVNGGAIAAIPSVAAGVPVWGDPGSSIAQPFGKLLIGRTADSTILKAIIQRKQHMAEGDALSCSGTFQAGVSPTFDVNVTAVPVGDGMSLERVASEWTCDPGSFGTGDGCDCSCGLADPDCGSAGLACTTLLAQDWSDTGLITTDDDWSGVVGITGHLGNDDLISTPGLDPQTLMSGTPTPIDVNANQVTTFGTGGVAELDALPDPVVALQGSGTADAPYLLFTVDTTGQTAVQVSYNLRDVDGLTTDDAITPVALQYRVGSGGSFTNVPAGFVADATTGPNLATLVTPVSVDLPVDAANQPLVQIRVITANAAGVDEWVGIDDILVIGLN